MKHVRAMPLLLAALLAILAGFAPLSGQDFTPPQAWAELRSHGAAVEQLYIQYDGTIVQLQDLMKRSPPYSAAGDDLLAFRNLIALKHRQAVYTLWSSAGGGSISNALRIAQNDFGQLEKLRDRFLELPSGWRSSGRRKRRRSLRSTCGFSQARFGIWTGRSLSQSLTGSTSSGKIVGSTGT
jgi:hypothetical protein